MCQQKIFCPTGKVIVDFVCLNEWDFWTFLNCIMLTKQKQKIRDQNVCVCFSTKKLAKWVGLTIQPLDSIPRSKSVFWLECTCANKIAWCWSSVG